MSLKIEDLKVRDELVCIDLKSMEKAWENASDLWRKAKIDVLKISHINVEGGLVHFQDGKFYLERHELKYFKKKEQSQYTFDDLIDVSTKAFKDGVLYQSNLVKGRLDYKADFNDEQTTVFDDANYNFESHINFIQSLYKETFVIEREEDIKRIKAGAKITLNNGNLLTVKNTYFIVEDHISIDAYTDECTTCQNLNRNIGIVFLKGATVEQKRLFA